MQIDICLSTDENYAKYCATTIISIIKNKNEDDELKFHILHSGLSSDVIEKMSTLGDINFYTVDEEEFKPYFKKSKIPWTIQTFYRLKIASLLDLDKVIYFDCDMIVRASISSLWKENIDDYYLAAVPDISYQSYMVANEIPQENDYFYFNAGMVYLNLKKMREDNIEEKLFDCLIAHWQDIKFADQDIMNRVLYKKTKKVSVRYNYIPYTVYHTKKELKLHCNPVVVHYAGIKPWERGFNSKFREEFWDYYVDSPFITKERFAKEFWKYCFGKTKLMQLVYFFKLYPFPFIKQCRRKSLLKILLDF